VTDINSFPKEEITKLIKEATSNADLVNPDFITKTSIGKSIVMSISEKKIRPLNHLN